MQNQMLTAIAVQTCIDCPSIKSWFSKNADCRMRFSDGFKGIGIFTVHLHLLLHFLSLQGFYSWCKLEQGVGQHTEWK